MTDTAPKTGLDALVEEAMQRKIVPTQQEAFAGNHAVLVTPQPDGEVIVTDPVAVTPAHVPSAGTDAVTEKGRAESPGIGPAPDASLHFMVNGVKVAVLIHVEPGAKVTLPSTRSAAAPSGPKVRGVRNRAADEDEAVSVAPSAPQEPVKTSEPFPNDIIDWKCPEHGQAEVKKSTVTGREYVKCPVEGCNQLAPK